ncbi:MAG TPA: SPOR domain-containing protein [Usitatibacter sp.]|jgi:cell division protein FtsN|nr:SPOR domain-containing protein [Usitatibacter sp.]
MAKDYKDSPSPRAESRLSHPMLLGIIIGLLLGILISLSVALWLNRLSNPFVEKGRQAESPSHVPPAPAPASPEPQRTPERTGRGADKAPVVAEEKPARTDRPRFEFYQILPGEKNAETEAKAAAKSPAPPVVVKPGSSPAAPKPHSGEIYWLQAGAFTDQKEADNQKAKIALTGLEATVKPADVPGRGTLFRVRLGPYQSLDDANRMKSTLAQNGVAAAIIHTTPEDAKTP